MRTFELIVIVVGIALKEFHFIGYLCWHSKSKIEFDLLATTGDWTSSGFVVCDFSIDQTTIENEMMPQSADFQWYMSTVCVICHVLLKKIVKVL